MQNKEWLQNLKVGDVVFRTQNYTSAMIKVTVKRITKTQIITTNNEKFWKKDGYNVGGGTWDTQRIYEATPELMEKFKIDELKRLAIRLKQKIIIPNTRPELEKLIGYLKEFVKVENAGE
jgi:hypothetical protein